MRLQIQLISAAAKQSQAAAGGGGGVQREWGGQPAGDDVEPHTPAAEASPGVGLGGTG